MLPAIRICFLLLPLLLGLPAGAGDYLVRPGDTLRVEIVEDPSMNRDVLVGMLLLIAAMPEYQLC